MKPVPLFGEKTVNGTINNSRNLQFDMRCYDNQNVFSIALYGDWAGGWSMKNLTLDPGNNTWVNYTYILNDNEADGNYHWSVFCNDSSNNSDINYTNRTFTLDTTAPTVSLNLPQDRNYTNSTRVTFSCSAADTNLSNMTLYGNWSGGWHANETKSLTNQNNFTTFTKTLITNTYYMWNCRACDGLGQCSFNSENFTFTIDSEKPKLTLISPDDDTLFGSDTTSVTFQWLVKDNYAPIINCTIYTKGKYQSEDNCENATTCERTISGYSSGGYTWKVNCSDGINQNISATRSFTIDWPSEGESGGGGGGGGGGGACGDGSCNRTIAVYLFNCSARDYAQLYNISLFGSWGPGWHIDELKNIGGQDIEVSFIRTFNTSATYLWNCYVCGRLPSGYLRCSFVMPNQTAVIIPTGGNENSDNCCQDCGCPSGQSCTTNGCSAIPTCGNNICDIEQGETFLNCCQDCLCPSGEICTALGCTSQSYCGDSVCDANNGETLDTCPLDCIFSPISCGNGICDKATENVATCPQDCKSVCGNKICEATENQDSCCKDCGCPEGRSCQDNKCSKKAVDLSGFWRVVKKGFLPLIIIIVAALIAFGAYMFIKRYRQKSLIQVMIYINKEIDKKKVNEAQARVRREQVDLSPQNKRIRENIDTGLRICQELLTESIEKGEISAVHELAETKKELLKKTSLLFEKYIDIIKKERSPFEKNVKKIILEEEIPLYENLRRTIAHLYNVGRQIRMAKSPVRIS